MIGSDIWVNQRWQYYDELMKGYRAWLGDLPSDVARLSAPTCNACWPGQRYSACCTTKR